MQFPSTANLVCDMVGVRNIGSFDVQAACSGFLYSLTIAAQFIANGAARKVVVVGADKMSSIIDYRDRATCVLFGDAAGAVLLEPDEVGCGIMDALIHSDGSGMIHLHQKAGGSRMPADCRDGRQPIALCPPGGRGCLQIRDRKDGGSLR